MMTIFWGNNRTTTNSGVRLHTALLSKRAFERSFTAPFDNCERILKSCLPVLGSSGDPPDADSIIGFFVPQYVGIAA